MQEKPEKPAHFLAKILGLPWVQGPLLGSMVMICITPFIRLTNYTLKGERMPLSNPMSGALTFALSSIPNYAMTFFVKSLLKKPEEETTKGYDLYSSFVAGGASGLVCTPFESVGQNIQMTKYSSTDVAKKIVRHHGYKGLFHGGSCVLLREGMWATVFFSAIPFASEAFQRKGYAKNQADAFSIILVACSNSLLTAPVNQLKFRKQQGLTEAGKSKSYLEHVRDIYNQGGTDVSPLRRMGYFYKAWQPRIMTSLVASGVMAQGREMYEKGVRALEANP